MGKHTFALNSLLVLSLAGVNDSLASIAPSFASTSGSGVFAWEVATHVGGADGQYSSFYTAGFAPAVARANAVNWIANNESGTNGWIGRWTFFTFRQQFDLTGFDPATAELQFRWAADDSGEGFADRGTWRPVFSLNSLNPLDFQNYDPYGGPTYAYSNLTTVNKGFVPGMNTIYFFVEGNGVTDGMSLQTVSFTAVPVPEPETYGLLLAGLGIVGYIARRRRM